VSDTPALDAFLSELQDDFSSWVRSCRSMYAENIDLRSKLAIAVAALQRICGAGTDCPTGLELEEFHHFQNLDFRRYASGALAKITAPADAEGGG
jgi:hypothetical protein